MKPIMNYKEVQAALTLFYSHEALQLTYAHPYEYPYVISVLVEKIQMFDLRVVGDMRDVFNVECEHKQLGKKILLCVYAK